MAENDDDELTTVQITKRTSRLLAQLGKAYKRSKTDQVAWMVENEAKELSKYKLLPSAEEKALVSE